MGIDHHNHPLPRNVEGVDVAGSVDYSSDGSGEGGRGCSFRGSSLVSHRDSSILAFVSLCHAETNTHHPF